MRWWKDFSFSRSIVPGHLQQLIQTCYKKPGTLVFLNGKWMVSVQHCRVSSLVFRDLWKVHWWWKQRGQSASERWTLHAVSGSLEEKPPLVETTRGFFGRMCLCGKRKTPQISASILFGLGKCMYNDGWKYIGVLQVALQLQESR